MQVANNKDEEIVVSRKLGEGAYLGGVPTKLLIPWLSMLVFFGCLCLAVNTVASVSPYWFIYLYIVAMSTHWHLLRKKPWEFVGKFINAPDWTLGYPRFEYKNGQIDLKKVGKKKIASWLASKDRVVKAFEDELHLVSLVEYRLDGLKVGAYLLKKNGIYKLVFPFYLIGINDNSTEERIFAKIAQLRFGLRSLPEFEGMTIVVRRMSSCKERLRVLKRLWQNCTNPKVKYTINSLGKRTKQLKGENKHNPVEAIVRVSYTLGDTNARGKDSIEQFLAGIEDIWLKYIGKKAVKTKKRTRENLSKAYYRGFVPALNLFKEQLGLSVVAMQANEIHEYEHFRVNNKAPQNPLPPQVIVVTNSQIWPEFNCSTHISTYWHLNAIPVADKAWVRLPGIDKYVGGAILVEKPGKLKKALAQLRVASEIVNSIEDVEVIIELSKPDQQQVLEVARWRTKDSHIEAKLNDEKGKIDRKGKRNLDEDVAVEDKFYDHEVAINLAMVVMVYRDNPREVDLAISSVAAKPFFSPPALLSRELEYFHLIYLQSLATTWQKMLVSPMERRLMFFSDEVGGLLPLAFRANSTNCGLQLISDRGHAPIYVNLYERDFPRHMAIDGMTGSGKSFLLAGAGSMALAHNMKVTFIDSTRSDGTGTFTDWTKFYDGSYYDCLSEKINLVEVVDTSVIEDPLKRLTREAIEKELIRQSLLALVVDRNSSGSKKKRYRHLLNLAVHAYLEDPELKARWQTAHSMGRSSSAWGFCPTLKDFLAFLDPDYLESVRSSWLQVTNFKPTFSNEQKQDLADIRLALESFMYSPLGQNLSQPTSISYDADLVTIGIAENNDEEYMEVLALAAHSIAVRRALSCDRSLLGFDEASYLVGNFDCMSKILGTLMAKARKTGVSVVWATQELDSIAKSQHAKQIFDNTSYYAIGRIKDSAIKDTAAILGIPEAVLARNTQSEIGDLFSLSEREFATPWLYKDASKLEFCRYAPALNEISLLLNQPHREAERKAFYAKYKDPYLANEKHTEHYVNSVLKKNA
ncbi:MAG: hypothetical protein QNJ38_18505 [Prochloraceae cyanobacterium]|nr:hypothetical protein [Prochloraceae cyanobacterium]